MACTHGHVPMFQPTMSIHRETCYKMFVCLRQYNTYCTIDLNGCLVQLGAGTAVPGIVAAKCGAQVTLTDHTISGQQLTAVCQLNDVADHVRVKGVPWGLFSEDVLEIGQQDIILASDCMYESQGVDVLESLLYNNLL